MNMMEQIIITMFDVQPAVESKKAHQHYDHVNIIVNPLYPTHLWEVQQTSHVLNKL